MLNPSKSPLLVQKTLTVAPPGQGEGDVFTWGGATPRLCSNLPKSFCWDNDYTDLQPNAPYVQFLKDLGYDVERDLAFEFRGYHRWTCENSECPQEDVYLPVITSGRYHPQKSFKHVSRVVGRVMDKIRFVQKHAPADYLINLDLTCPAWVSDRAGDHLTLDRLRKAVNRFLTNLRKECFHEQKSQLGGVYAVHTWATKRPLDKHLHVHLSIFNVAFNPREKTFYRFKPMLDHLKIKRAWQKSLKSVGLWDNPNDNSLPDCHIHYFKLSDAPRLIHRLRYVFRKPIVDLNRNLTFDFELDKAWAIKVLNYTPRQVQIGFMLKLKKLGYVCSKSFSELCPRCGQPMRLDVVFVAVSWKGQRSVGKPPPPMKKPRPYPGNFPELPHLVRVGSEWVETKPPLCEGQNDIDNDKPQIPVNQYT